MASELEIAPSLGHGLVTAQGQPGGYDAIDDRAFWGIGKQEGAIGAGAFKVTERAAGANMTVDVAVDTGLFLVQGDTVTGQGLYVVRAHPVVANLDIGAADPTNPRIDQVVLEVADDEHDSSGNTYARVYVLEGTPTAGADIDDRLGAVDPLPDSTARLGDVFVDANATSIEDADIRDRRQWGLGAYSVGEYTGGDIGPISQTSFGIIHANIAREIECSGAPMKARLWGRVLNAASLNMGLALAIDTVVEQQTFLSLSTVEFAPLTMFQWDFIPAAGHHEITSYINVSASSITVDADANVPLKFTVEEILRPDASNG